MIHSTSSIGPCMTLRCCMHSGGYEAFWRLADARAEIAAVNEAMKTFVDLGNLWVEWRGPLRYNACTEPCDNWNGPCVCGAWHKDGK